MDKEKHRYVIGVFLWWLLPDSNWGHAALQAAALPAELKSHPAGIEHCFTSALRILYVLLP